jgi:hypothetical protein
MSRIADSFRLPAEIPLKMSEEKARVKVEGKNNAWSRKSR